MFFSILYPDAESAEKTAVVSDKFLQDIGLSDTLCTIARQCANPEALYAPSTQKGTVEYRQAIMRDLEDFELRRRFDCFSRQMTKLQYFVDTVCKETKTYAECVRHLSASMQYIDALREFTLNFPYEKIKSEGLRLFMWKTNACVSAPDMVRMRMDIMALQRELQSVEYVLLMSSDKLQVCPFEGQADMNSHIESLFLRFRENTENSSYCPPPAGKSDERIENEVLNLTAAHYPELFTKWKAFCETYTDFANETVLQFAKEVTVYLRYMDHIDKLKAAGLPFCYPAVDEHPDAMFLTEGFDLTLADRLAEQGKKPVLNDFSLFGSERIIVVTGPNQGGKTTFARMFAQINYLAALGFPVPGSNAHLMLCDRYFTHFSASQSTAGSSGLKDELLRLKAILQESDERSIVIINEIFAAAQINDASFLGHQMMESLVRIGCIGVCVTFVDELAEFGPQTVSMMSETEPGDSTNRTYRIQRRPPDGNAMALQLAEANGLTYECLKARLSK